jgi:hypothetical protein
VDYEALTEHPSTVYPYRLANTASEYMVRVPHLFMDPAERDHVSDLFLLELPKIDHLTPVVHMVDIRQIGGDSLSTILEESTGSTGSTQTHTIINPYEEEFPAFPPGFRGAIFAISVEVERNTDRTAHRVERENAKEVRANAEGRRPIRRDLADAFDMCGNQQVHKTPSTNIAITMNELAKLPQSPALDTVMAYLKAAMVQVNEN